MHGNAADVECHAHDHKKKYVGGSRVSHEKKLLDFWRIMSTACQPVSKQKMYCCFWNFGRNSLEKYMDQLTL